ncbi:hypothetical protein [Pedobacter sp. ASV28]|uniref:hypothetical protein n=1 Tax=Pedobacter sp. ASV28 TaxID=2795123 RepID=UPI0018ECF475|nr:hypothetical protein [Pedobacter sp. ASV28]
MKKVFLLTILLFQITFVFGQSKECIDKYNKVTQFLKNIKTCEQANQPPNAELKSWTDYVTENCPLYAAEHKDWQIEMDRISKLGCNGSTQGKSSQSSNSSPNSNGFGGFIPSMANDPIYKAGNQLMGALGNLAVEQQAQAKINVGKDAQREIVELSKLDVEPDNELVNSPEDYLNVSLTTKKISNLNKLGTISITRKSPTIFVSEDDVKVKVYKATKINATFFGANTVFVKSLDFRRILADKPVVEIFGFAYNNKPIEYRDVENAFKLNKLFKTSQCYKYKINETDFDKEKCIKSVEIIEVVKIENAINVNAKIEGVKFTSFKLINFNKTSFTLMYFDKEKEKIYNFLIPINE